MRADTMRADTPVGSPVPTDDTYSIQMPESYDIRNDDIAEDIFVSYDTLQNSDIFPFNNSNSFKESYTTPTVQLVPPPAQMEFPHSLYNEHCDSTPLSSPLSNPEHFIHSTENEIQHTSFLLKINNDLQEFRNHILHRPVPIRSDTSQRSSHELASRTESSSETNNRTFVNTYPSQFVSTHSAFDKPDRMQFAVLFDGDHPSNNIQRTTSPTIIDVSAHNMNDNNTIRSTLETAFILSNSPISSQSNSDSEQSDHDSAANPAYVPVSNQYLMNEHIDNALSRRKMRFKKISYEEIEQSLSRYYDKRNKYSNEVDILITFIRGQKHLYNQSNYITQTKLYAITITALSITSLITVITPFIQKYWWRIIFVMTGNAITTILITILKYMRFESTCSTFTLLANHYEHYEKSLQITTNKLVFIHNETEQVNLVLDKMREIEFKMSETNELCPVIIPPEVQTTFPVIFQTNIFTLIKKMDVHRKTLILQLKNIKNEIRYILFKWNADTKSQYTADMDTSTTPQTQREKVRLLSLMDQKEKIKKELIEYYDNYSQIDDLFMKEIKYAELNKTWWRFLFCSPKKIRYDSYTNPIIKEHLELILGN